MIIRSDARNGSPDLNVSGAIIRGTICGAYAELVRRRTRERSGKVAFYEQGDVTVDAKMPHQGTAVS